MSEPLFEIVTGCCFGTAVGVGGGVSVTNLDKLANLQAENEQLWSIVRANELLHDENDCLRTENTESTWLREALIGREAEIERLEADYDAVYKNYVIQRDEIERLRAAMQEALAAQTAQVTTACLTCADGASSAKRSAAIERVRYG